MSKNNVKHNFWDVEFRRTRIDTCINTSVLYVEFSSVQKKNIEEMHLFLPFHKKNYLPLSLLLSFFISFYIDA